MKCVKCGKKIYNGAIVIHGVNNSYKICRDCLNKEVDIPIAKIYEEEKPQKKFETQQKKKYLQEQVDKRMWEVMK